MLLVRLLVVLCVRVPVKRSKSLDCCSGSVEGKRHLSRVSKADSGQQETVKCLW